MSKHALQPGEISRIYPGRLRKYFRAAFMRVGTAGDYQPIRVCQHVSFSVILFPDADHPAFGKMSSYDRVSRHLLDFPAIRQEIWDTFGTNERRDIAQKPVQPLDGERLYRFLFRLQYRTCCLFIFGSWHCTPLHGSPQSALRSLSPDGGRKLPGG